MTYSLTIQAGDDTLNARCATLGEAIDVLCHIFGVAVDVAIIAQRVFAVGSYFDEVCGAYVTLNQLRS